MTNLVNPDSNTLKNPNGTILKAIFPVFLAILAIAAALISVYAQNSMELQQLHIQTLREDNKELRSMFQRLNLTSVKTDLAAQKEKIRALEREVFERKAK